MNSGAEPRWCSVVATTNIFYRAVGRGEMNRYGALGGFVAENIRSHLKVSSDDSLDSMMKTGAIDILLPGGAGIECEMILGD